MLLPIQSWWHAPLSVSGGLRHLDRILVDPSSRLMVRPRRLIMIAMNIVHFGRSVDVVNAVAITSKLSYVGRVWAEAFCMVDREPHDDGARVWLAIASNRKSGWTYEAITHGNPNHAKTTEAIARPFLPYLSG